MNVDDVVYIFRQPPDLIVQMEGERGYIEEIYERSAQVYTFDRDGKVTGMGWVPLDYLKLETGQDWCNAKERLDAEREGRYQQIMEHSRLYAERLAAVAAKHGITAAKIREIVSDMGDFCR
jgi:hypothetical protein